MKKTIFYILINIKVHDGFESIGKFYVGNNRSFAYNLFKQLKGKDEVTENSVLSLGLMEASDELPLNLQIISCSLEELACNCKIITKEIFKQLNLEEG